MKPKSIFARVKDFILQRGNLSQEREFIITVEDLSCRSSYDKFIKRLKSVDKRYIRQLRIRNLKNKFAIQQWKEIERIIRGWSLTSLKFEVPDSTRNIAELCFIFLKIQKRHRETGVQLQWAHSES